MDEDLQVRAVYRPYVRGTSAHPQPPPPPPSPRSDSDAEIETMWRTQAASEMGGLGRCAATGPIDLVFIIDETASLSGTELSQAHHFAMSFVDHFIVDGSDAAPRVWSASAPDKGCSNPESAGRIAPSASVACANSAGIAEVCRYNGVSAPVGIVEPMELPACKALCEASSGCVAVAFRSPTCQLYGSGATGFNDPPTTYDEAGYRCYTSSAPMAGGGTRVGVVAFASKAVVAFDLAAHSSNGAVKVGIAAMPTTHGARVSGSAAEEAYGCSGAAMAAATTMLSGAGSRTNARKIVVLITDGMASEAPLVCTEFAQRTARISALKTAADRIIPVAIRAPFGTTETVQDGWLFSVTDGMPGFADDDLYHLAPAGRAVCDYGVTPTQSKCEAAALSVTPRDHAQETCCMTCSAGVACGDTCIATTSTCSIAPGCACNAEGFMVGADDGVQASWGGVPTGCSIDAREDRPATYSAHFKTDSGALDPSYYRQLVCSGLIYVSVADYAKLDGVVNSVRDEGCITAKPTVAPTSAPTSAPTTLSPTHAPTNLPTAAPSKVPTHAPTLSPTLGGTCSSIDAAKCDATNGECFCSASALGTGCSKYQCRCSAGFGCATPGSDLASGADVGCSTCTDAPTAAPTAVPTHAPSSAPTKTPSSAPTSAPSSAPTMMPTATPTIWAMFNDGVAGQESIDNSDIPPAATAGAAVLGVVAIVLIVIGAVVAAAVVIALLATGGAIIAKKTMHKIDESHIQGQIVEMKAVPRGSEFVPDAQWIERRLSTATNPMQKFNNHEVPIAG